ncbi:MAG: hypothetical protein FJ109_21775 [Deltaproteobacteria bacterium]|nr:hypothetical protein [Deltaproteobacteria bacterium]
MWEAITDPLVRLGELLVANGPKFLATLVILLGGWLVCRAVRLVLVRGLRIARLDLVAEKAGIESFLKKGGLKQDSVDLLGALVYWIGIIVLLIIVMKVWNIEVGLSTTLVPFLPRIFVSLVILILGLYLAAFVGDLVRTAAANAEMMYAPLLGQILRYILVIFVVLTALQQLGIETELISKGFLLILASLCLGFGLAIGLGAKDLVGKRLDEWIKKIEEENRKQP